VYLFGYFQSEKYFKPHIDVIKNLIGIDELQQKIFQKFDFLCDFTNTVSMHFRLGDYKYLPEHHPVLEYEYYENAVRYILNKNYNAAAGVHLQLAAWHAPRAPSSSRPSH
jgi:hypothetical protein